MRVEDPTPITHLRHLPSYRNGDITHTDVQAFGKDFMNGGKNLTQFDTFYADGVGLSWRTDNENGMTHTIDDMSDENPGNQGGAEKEWTQ